MAHSIRSVHLAVVLWAILAMIVLAPAAASAKVYFYALTTNGELLKYDPDADQVQQKKSVGDPDISFQVPARRGQAETRILDMARQRLVTVDVSDAGAYVALINLQSSTTRKISLAPGLHVDDIEHFIYPRKASRFYVRWFPKRTSSQLRTPMLSSIDLTGQVLASGPSPFDSPLPPIYHPNGRDFYLYSFTSNQATLFHGDTLEVLGHYDLTPLAQPGLRGPALLDVRDGRALLGGIPVTDTSERAPETLFTTDLTFSPASASSLIATGLPRQGLLLFKNGQTVLLQEMRLPRSASGSGRLHFFDVTTGAKLGVVELPVHSADLLGVHPDGRRLFLRALNLDQPGTPQFQLMIVDLASRTIIRNRPFEAIGVASDFVDEP